MKVTCIKDCQLEQYGIIREGETLEIDDGYAHSARVKGHFVIDESTIKDPKAKLPDPKKSEKAQREKVEKLLMSSIMRLKVVGKLRDDGLEVPDYLIDEVDELIGEERRAAELADLYIEHYGFDTAALGTPKDEKAAKKKDPQPDLFEKDK